MPSWLVLSNEPGPQTIEVIPLGRADAGKNPSATLSKMHPTEIIPGGDKLRKSQFNGLRTIVVSLFLIVNCQPGYSQAASGITPNTGDSAQPVISSSRCSIEPFSVEPPTLNILDDSLQQPREAAVQSGETQPHGFIVRNLQRGLEDQKQLYLAPFQPKNVKWDALFLGVTGALIATDRQASRAVPRDHVNVSHDVALASLLGTGAAAGLIWLHGIRAEDSHASETGQLTLESLANTFVIYTPMQFAAGRERPDEAAGNGRFWQHPGVNTSFPAGHPMFTWAMASVIAHEYPKPWVKALAYGAAFSVSATRFTGRNHFPSDIWVGTVLGYLIGTHIFHAHCDPQFSEDCHRVR